MEANPPPFGPVLSFSRRGDGLTLFVKGKTSIEVWESDCLGSAFRHIPLSPSPSSGSVCSNDDYSIVISDEVWVYANRLWTMQKRIGPFLASVNRCATVSVQSPSESYIYSSGGLLNGRTISSVRVFMLKDGFASYGHLEPEGESPVPRHGHTLTRCGRRLIMFGGVGPYGRALDDVWELGIVENALRPSWRSCQVDGSIIARSGHLAWSDERTLWIAGGVGDDGVALNDVWKLDDGKKWVKVGYFDAEMGAIGVVEGKFVANSDRFMVSGVESFRSSYERRVMELVRRRGVLDERDERVRNVGSLESMKGELDEVMEILDRGLEEEVSEERTAHVEGIASILRDETKMMDRKMDTMVAEMACERGLYERTRKYLERFQNGDMPSDLDPASFAGFSNFTETMDEERRARALEYFVSLQALEYDTNDHKIVEMRRSMMEKRKRRIEMAVTIREQLAILRRTEAAALKEEQGIDCWNARADVLEAECEQADERVNPTRDEIKSIVEKLSEHTKKSVLADFERLRVLIDELE